MTIVIFRFSFIFLFHLLHLLRQEDEANSRKRANMCWLLTQKSFPDQWPPSHQQLGPQLWCIAMRESFSCPKRSLGRSKGGAIFVKCVAEDRTTCSPGNLLASSWCSEPWKRHPDAMLSSIFCHVLPLKLMWMIHLLWKHVKTRHTADTMVLLTRPVPLLPLTESVHPFLPGPRFENWTQSVH